MLYFEHGFLRKTASVFCQGGKGVCHDCEDGCNGCGDCVEVCPEKAIHINDRNIASVDDTKCEGCGKCELVCPNKVIRVIRPLGAPIVPACSNISMGKMALNACDNSCIACRACERVCPADAIKVINNHARISYNMCLSCGACIEACRRNVIVDRRGIFTEKEN